MLVGCVGTHAATGAWSLIAAGLFIRKDGLLDALFMSNVQNGLFYVSIGLYVDCFVVSSWNKIKLRSFKSSERINEKWDEPYRGFDQLSLFSDHLDLAKWSKR